MEKEEDEQDHEQEEGADASAEYDDIGNKKECPQIRQSSSPLIVRAMTGNSLPGQTQAARAPEQCGTLR